MADYNFKLTIGEITFPFPENTENEDVINVAYNLHGVKFNRKIYQPDVIEAEVSVYPPISISKITDMLFMKEAKLEMNNLTIAENYYVHEILPQKKSGDVGIFAKLLIYSMDKLMTLDKYSKVYAGEKLGSEILDTERKNFKLGDNAVSVAFDNMRMLKYMYSKIVYDSEKEKNILIEIPSEFIHPYLVQYNESFYDFMARTANRCGEFLYFEDGKLNLGLVTGDPKKISDYDSITYKSISPNRLDIERYARDSMKDKWGVMEKTNFDVVNKNKAGYPHDAFPGHTAYNSELASDEFFFPLYADKFTTYKREIGMGDTSGENAATQLFPKFADITANMSDIVDFAFKLTLDEGKTVDAAKKSAAAKNNDGKEAYINVNDITDRAKLLEKSDGQTCAVPFGTLSKDGWTTLDYYRDVRKYSEKLQRDIICIDMGTAYVDVKLGDLITLDDGVDPYIIIQIQMVNDKEWHHIYTEYDGNASVQTKTQQNQKIFAIPSLKTKIDGHDYYKQYPPILDAPVVRKAEPQTAFITDSNDPKYQGRVRIVYPWQTDSMGVMRKLAEAEWEYEKAQKDYQEKKQKHEQLENELNVLLKKKQILEDKTNDKSKAYEEINNEIKKQNETLNVVNKEDNTLKNDDTITNEMVKGEENKLDALNTEVKDLEKKLNEQYEHLNDLKSELAQLESELTQLKSDLADYMRQKRTLESEKAELEEKLNKEIDEKEKELLQAKINSDQEAINELVKLIGKNGDEKSGKNKEIADKETKIVEKNNEISNLKGDEQKADTIAMNEAELDKKKEKYEAQEKKWHLVEQKKVIQDYYAEVKTKNKTDIEKEIEVYENGKLTGGKRYDVDKAKEAKEAAKKVLTSKEDAINKMEKEVKNAIGKMASPWIRMTSPMATDGGGTIFKPRTGDEVLVNYECGNVERPYVVGSLFSKNVLEPDERINRQVGPNLHKGASIAIVSPNGHGITFKDPATGDGFVSSVYPGLGVISSYSNHWGKELPQSKDLAGGIKISDRYGLYSIDMSSDKRSVKISSSLGTVSLNAFTGITITAPNGDVRIEGKNVTIKAGNNLDISSGNNIDSRGKLAKKFDWAGKVDGVEGIGKKLVSQALKDFVTPFVDVSLARSVWETILRPVEGTALIKSRRYLKLEAGSGKAMIQHDRYTSKYEKLVDTSDKLKKTEEIIKQVVSCITDIDTLITGFCTTYKANWKDCFTKRNAYFKASGPHLKDKDDPDIWEEVSSLGDWQDYCLDDKFDGKFKDGTGLVAKRIVIFSANAYGKAIHTMWSHLLVFWNQYDPGNLANLSQEEQDAKNAMKDAFDKLKNESRASWSNFYDNNPEKFLTTAEPTDVFADPVFLKRKWAALLLAELSDKKDALGQRTYEFVFDCLGGKMPSDSTLKDNYEWNSYVSNLEKYKMGYPLLRAAFDTVIKKPLYEDTLKPFANPVKDMLMWNEKEAGDILLSQDPDWTVDFKKGKANGKQEANTGNLDWLKKKLYGLK